MSERPVVLVSNRGPLSFAPDDAGELTARRGAGGLVSGLAPLVAGSDALWVAAAMSEGDRMAAAQGTVEAEGLRARLLDIDPEVYRLAYDVVSNETLWFVHHGLYHLPNEPGFGAAFRDAWQAYRSVNTSFAEALAEEAPPEAVVLVQDFHLALVGRDLAKHRADVTTVHFAHTPFAPPDWFSVLPPPIADELLQGLAAYRACGFHTQRWAADFEACYRELSATPAPPTFVSPLPADAEGLRRTTGSPACTAAYAELDELAGDRAVIARVDRIELSKNIVRGFRAFDELLATRPEWRGRVVFMASVYPSRSGLPAYRRYQDEVQDTVDRVNRRWATSDWTPVTYDTSDDYPRSVALLQRADVLLVNPLRDGLNLVAKEGALVNERDAVLCLSPEAGVWSELGAAALPVHPYDIAGTADVLDTALSMEPEERRARARQLRAEAGRRRPADWLADQLAAAG